MRNRTEQPQDIQNMIRRMLWHKRQQQAPRQDQEKQEQLEHITYTSAPNTNTSFGPPTKQRTQEIPTPEPQMGSTPSHNKERTPSRNNKPYGDTRICQMAGRTESLAMRENECKKARPIQKKPHKTLGASAKRREGAIIPIRDSMPIMWRK